MPRIADVGNCIHRNEPHITSLYLSCRLTVHPQFCGVELRYDHQESIESNYDIIEFSHQDTWRQIGQAIGSNPTLVYLTTFGGLRGNVDHTTARSLAAVYEGMKESKSVQHLQFALLPNEAPIFDLHYFVRNNPSLKSITMDSPFENPMQTEQSDMIRMAVDNCALNSLDISTSCFANDGSQEQIISVCQRVKRLKISCNTDATCDALATLLQDRTAVLNKLEVVGGLSDCNGLSAILTSLSQNTKLKGLELLNVGIDNEQVLNQIGVQLCDTSSIESIHNSNHTLLRVKLRTRRPLPEFIQVCLKLNKNKNKLEVIRQKIAKHYFKGDFDVSPLAIMHTSLLPRVMRMVDETHRQSAIFRLLKSIPALFSGFSKDNDVEMVFEHSQHSSKKQKTIREW